MRFSANFIEALLVKPLKYFFSNYAPAELRFNEDEKVSSIDISSMSDFNKEATQKKPRILVDRGPFRIDGVGLSDNMVEKESAFTTLGLTG